MAYKEPKLSPEGVKALMGAWNDGVVGKNAKKKTANKTAKKGKK